MENKYMTEWKRNSIRIGAPTCILAAFTAFIPVLYLCSRYNCWPSLEVVLSAWALTCSVLWCFLHRRADFLLRSPRYERYLSWLPVR